jgi:hypothetical protein
VARLFRSSLVRLKRSGAGVVRESSTSAEFSGATADGASPAPPLVGSRPSSLKIALFAGVLVALVVLVTLAAVRETTVRARAAGPVLPPPRPAPTAAEEVYARTLWSIHDPVKSEAFRMTMIGLRFKLGDADRTALQTGLEAAAGAFQTAERQVRALTPPPSLQGVHAEYLEAVQLFQRSVNEMRRTADDGRPEHLVAAFPLSQEASRKLLHVGKAIWPGEYVPN